MLFRIKELRNLVISVLVISAAFAVQNLSLDFFLQCFLLVVISYSLHEALHSLISSSEGIYSRCDVWPLGILVTLASGILSGGVAVLALPSIIRLRESETARWRKESFEIAPWDVGVASISGPLSNLVLATGFFALFKFYGLAIFELGALINFWIAFANLIPWPPIDGSKIMSWDRWVWFLSLAAAVVGIAGLMFI